MFATNHSNPSIFGTIFVHGEICEVSQGTAYRWQQRLVELQKHIWRSVELRRRRQTWCRNTITSRRLWASWASRQLSALVSPAQLLRRPSLQTSLTALCRVELFLYLSQNLLYYYIILLYNLLILYRVRLTNKQIHFYFINILINFIKNN